MSFPRGSQAGAGLPNAKLRTNPKLSAISVISYCNRCGSSVSHTVPAGDSLPRSVCNACGYIQYENPRLVVGCVAEYEERILLCRRAIEPRLGFWTLPAGFMENGETTAQAACRETFEEAGARIILDAPFAMISIAHINQVHLFYRGRMISPDYSAGEESLEVELFRAEDIPWNELSFRSVGRCLEQYLADRSSGSYGFHESDLAPETQSSSR